MRSEYPLAHSATYLRDDPLADSWKREAHLHRCRSGDAPLPRLSTHSESSLVCDVSFVDVRRHRCAPLARNETDGASHRSVKRGSRASVSESLRCGTHRPWTPHARAHSAARGAAAAAPDLTHFATEVNRTDGWCVAAMRDRELPE